MLPLKVNQISTVLHTLVRTPSLAEKHCLSLKILLLEKFYLQPLKDLPLESIHWVKALEQALGLTEGKDYLFQNLQAPVGTNLCSAFESSNMWNILTIKVCLWVSLTCPKAQVQVHTKWDCTRYQNLLVRSFSHSTAVSTQCCSRAFLLSGSQLFILVNVH